MKPVNPPVPQRAERPERSAWPERTARAEGRGPAGQPLGGRTANQAIHDHPTLAGLLESWQSAQRCMEWVRPLLGEALASQLRPGPMDASQWVLLADHGQAAAKVRQMLPLLAERLAEEGLPGVTVKVKVAPRSAAR